LVNFIAADDSPTSLSKVGPVATALATVPEISLGFQGDIFVIISKFFEEKSTVVGGKNFPYLNRNRTCLWSSFMPLASILMKKFSWSCIMSRWVLGKNFP